MKKLFILLIASALFLTSCGTSGTGVSSKSYDLSSSEGFTAWLLESSQESQYNAHYISELDAFNSECTTETWIDSSQRVRTEAICESSKYDDSHTVFIMNGNEIWGYEPLKNSYYHETSAEEVESFRRFIEFNNLASILMTASEVRHEEGGIVTGRPTYKVSIITIIPDFKEGTSEVVQEMWVDKENGFPLKGYYNQNALVEVEYNPSFSNNTFEFDPPAGAEEKESGGLLHYYSNN